jgi:uncharacterized protein YceH (UPF0502 family)
MELEIRLDALEARVFGVLVEKALTTPDQYPLSVNAATTGANQKVNREPVLSLGEDDVEMALQRLERKYMARKVFPAGSRVEKYCHNGKDALGIDAPRLAVLAELLLRGPQTPGELRAHAGRMTPIESLDQLLSVLASLIERGFVRRLPPAAGSRAERYVQLLSPDLHPLGPPVVTHAASGEASTGSGAAASADLAARVAALESEIRRLRDQVRALVERLGLSADE